MSKKQSRKHVGGSQASDLVMGYVNNSGHSVESPGVPKLAGNVDDIGKMLYKTTGGGCGCSGNKKNTKMMGGSRNSDMVMAYAKKVAQAGGRRKVSKKSKKSVKKSKKSVKKSIKKSMRGGSATAIRDTLYSRVYNGGRTDDAPFFNAFTNEKYLSQDFLANQEPNLGANPPYIE